MSRRGISKNSHYYKRVSIVNIKKHLGQHFLKSNIVLEIGPGTGALTALLLASAKQVIAIEKDRELIPLLQEKFATEIANGTLQLIEADVLNFDPSVLANTLSAKTYKLIANIPYYITGAIIEKFLSTPYQPTCMVLLIQKEVAERICTKDPNWRPGRPVKESILSIAVKAYGTPKIIAKVPPGAFVPPPTVDSAILSIENISRDFFEGCDEKLFLAVMKSVFGKKRKQIGGSLTEFLGDKPKALSVLEKSGIDTKTRPEDMTLQTWKKLTQSLEQ
jgi:16S rRNA (adenine1518-N6/adenine1519-N6)-dimethyltransferase